MPQARPLLQAALEEHFGGFASRVLKSGTVRFEEPRFSLEIMTRIRGLSGPPTQLLSIPDRYAARPLDSADLEW